MTECLQLQSVSLNYGDFPALRNASLSLQTGEIACLLGPSGCGKTTLLRAIAGFEPVSDGEIHLHGELISARQLTRPPEQRRVGMVFQDFALFPHLNVRDNIGFGLQGLGRAQRRTRIQEMLELIGLPALARAYPHQLSGGQQQRVALARALAPAPELLLLDEPFSGLDAELREELATEIRALLKASGVTALLVTHDQHEAFAMADRITLMQSGQVVQSGTPEQLYQQPANAFAGAFIGEGALIACTQEMRELLDLETRLSCGDDRLVLIRPEAVYHNPQSSQRFTVRSRVFRGAQYLYQLQLPNDQCIPCLTAADIKVAEGDSMPITIDANQLVLLPAS